MRPTRHVPAVLLLAAIAAVGCSKQDDGPRAQAELADRAQPKPVTTSGESLSLKLTGAGGTDGGEAAAAAVPAAAVPVATVVPATFADGQTAYAARNYSAAATIFEGYTARRPASASGHYMLGLSAWKSGDLARAEGAFEKALSHDPRHVKSLVNLGRVLIEQKRSEQALERLMRAAEIDPYSPEVHRVLGRTYHALGRTDEAVDAYREAIELNELDAWSMNNLGLLFLETQRADKAVPLFAEAVELRQEVALFHNNLGMALEHTGRLSDAAAAYGGALTADPGYDKAKKNLARVEAVKAGREQKAASR